MKKWIVYGLAAVLAFVLLWCVTFRAGQDSAERTQRRIVVLGDSLVGQCRDETSVTENLSKMLGEPVYNGAMGGTCMAYRKEDASMTYGKDLLSMVCLSDAVAADDFGAQLTVRSREEAADYFWINIKNLAEIDYSSVEILVIEYGLNDYHAAVPIENPDFPMDENTFAGAVRSVVRKIKDVYPDMRIVLVTPTYTWYLSRGLTCEEYDTGNGYLEKYVEAMIRTAQEAGVEVVDLYHTAYTHDVWEDWMVYTEDGMHPNEKGRLLIAERIAEQLGK